MEGYYIDCAFSPNPTSTSPKMHFHRFVTVPTVKSWAWEEGESDIQPRWLRELHSQESLLQIDRATKFVHIRRGSKTWSTVLQPIDPSAGKSLGVRR